jgi:hypothetical protein
MLLLVALHLGTAWCDALILLTWLLQVVLHQLLCLLCLQPLLLELFWL